MGFGLLKSPVRHYIPLATAVILILMKAVSVNTIFHNASLSLSLFPPLIPGALTFLIDLINYIYVQISKYNK